MLNFIGTGELPEEELVRRGSLPKPNVESGLGGGLVR